MFLDEFAASRAGGSPRELSPFPLLPARREDTPERSSQERSPFGQHFRHEPGASSIEEIPLVERATRKLQAPANPEGASLEVVAGFVRR